MSNRDTKDYNDLVDAPADRITILKKRAEKAEATIKAALQAGEATGFLDDSKSRFRRVRAILQSGVVKS